MVEVKDGLRLFFMSYNPMNMKLETHKCRCKVTITTRKLIDISSKKVIKASLPRAVSTNYLNTQPQGNLIGYFETELSMWLKIYQRIVGNELRKEIDIKNQIARTKQLETELEVDNKLAHMIGLKINALK